MCVGGDLINLGCCMMGGLLVFDRDIKRLMLRCTFTGNVSISWRNCGLDVTLMSQYTCRPTFLGHWNE